MNNLGDRIKQYEFAQDLFLTKRVPVILKLDGIDFASISTTCEYKPYDPTFTAAMGSAAIEICNVIPNAKFAYLYSDNIIVLLTDFDSRYSKSWFNYNVQQMVSAAASITSNAFKKHWNMPGAFTAKVFNIPVDEVVNYFIHQQNKAQNKSILDHASIYLKEDHSFFGKEKDIKNLLLTKANFDWNSQPAIIKRGSCIELDNNGDWFFNNNIPIFANERNYIDRFIGNKNDGV